MIYKKLLTLCLCIAVSFTVACESDENNKIAQAESCINENASNESAIASCSSFLKGLTSPRANTLRCSITLSAGGLSNERIVSAIEVMDDASSNENELQFMALISLNNTDSANQIPSACSNTDSPGIEFVANAARMGTTLAGFLTSIDIEDIDEETVIGTTEVNEIYSGCAPDSACKELLGQSAESMYDIFCADADLSENEICADVNAAIDFGAGNYEDIGQALIDAFDPTP